MKMKPQAVQRVVCPKCGELMVKIYPWSSLYVKQDRQITICKRCQNKARAQHPRLAP